MWVCFLSENLFRLFITRDGIEFVSERNALPPRGQSESIFHTGTHWGTEVHIFYGKTDFVCKWAATSVEPFFSLFFMEEIEGSSAQQTCWTPVLGGPVRDIQTIVSALETVGC
jgi:hypothetical protein